MSDDQHNDPGRRAFDQIVREARDERTPPREPDWEAIEARLMERVTHERDALAEEARASGVRAGAMRIAAVVLAAAAAAALVVRDRSTEVLEPSRTVAAEAQAGSLRAAEGKGEVRIGGLSAVPGQTIRAGDVIEAEGARAVLERPRKVSWLLEREGGVARARVKSAEESLVLGLEDGAIEAQVTPVPSGEAFAVDVATGTSLVRVAVHGTHLRVTRNGSHVVVDLSEGVVSIGAPPRVGSTYGTLVTAPAHVELDADDVAHTIKVDHAPGAVRAPIPLSGHEHAVTTAKDPAPGNVKLGAAAPPPTANAKPAVETAARPKSDPAKALPPREAIAAAVRACAASRSKPGAVKVTVNSTLTLGVGATGDIERATFSPPLAPEVQSCAATEIYKIKLDELNANVSVPIEFSY